MGTTEDVVADLDGTLVCGFTDGAIVRLDPHAGTLTTVADTGGRPLGLEACDDGRVLVCDAHKGLLEVDQSTGSVERLVEQVDGVPLRFCSNAVAAPDGTVWFTESTDRFDFEHYMGALLEHRPSGRLFRRDPDGTVTTVLDGLYFPNGVTLAPDNSSLLFTETGNYSLSRMWLTGSRSGEVDVLLSNMNGFPDNMSRFVEGAVLDRDDQPSQRGTRPFSEVAWTHSVDDLAAARHTAARSEDNCVGGVCRLRRTGRR